MPARDTSRSQWLFRSVGVLAVVAASFVFGIRAAEKELPPYRWYSAVVQALLPHYREAMRRLDTAQGRFRPARREAAAPAGFDADQRSRIAALEAIGYAAGSTPAPAESGVTVYDAARVQPGLNLYTDGHRAEATLMGMRGEVVHRWQYDFEDAFPESGPIREAPGRRYWRRVRLLPNGELLAIYEGNGLVKLDARSQLLWAYPGGAHHDLDVLPDGRIYVLTRRAEVLPGIDPVRPVLHDFITVLSPDGRELDRISILEAIQRSDYEAALGGRFVELWKSHQGDILHTNTVEVLDGSRPAKRPAFAQGNVLISMRELSLIAVVDPTRRRLVWAGSGVWVGQHDPTLLANGNLLLFDNRGNGGHSQVLEIDPVSLDTLWAYRGKGRPLASGTCGSSQRLANGNTLVTESDNGRALEVTPEGESVWEFVTPHRAGEDGELIATLFEVVRLEPDLSLAWLPSRSAEASDPSD